MKQYLLMLDEQNIGLFKACMPAMQFIEVEAMGLNDNPNHRILVTPVIPPVIEQQLPHADETPTEITPEDVDKVLSQSDVCASSPE